MPPTEIWETNRSRRHVVGQTNSLEMDFAIFDASNDDIAAKNALIAVGPPVYDYKTKQQANLEPLGRGLFKGKLRYGDVKIPTPQQPEFNFDTTGGTVRITHSLATQIHGTDAPDHEGAIQFDGRNVQGCEIVVPAFAFSYSVYLPSSWVNQAYIFTLHHLTGRTNSAAWKGFAKGEVLFLGCVGRQKGAGDWHLRLSFSAEANLTGLDFGSITGVSKEGQQFLWVRYRNEEDASKPYLKPKPIGVYVETVYDYANYAMLGIGV